MKEIPVSRHKEEANKNRPYNKRNERKKETAILGMASSSSFQYNFYAIFQPIFCYLFCGWWLKNTVEIIWKEERDNGGQMRSRFLIKNKETAGKTRSRSADQPGGQGTK